VTTFRGAPAMNASMLSMSWSGERLDRLAARPGNLRRQNEVRQRQQRMSG